jgi:hypothetical protein
VIENFGSQAAVYGKCIVAQYQDVSKSMCQKEFMLFKNCVQKVASFRTSGIALHWATAANLCDVRWGANGEYNPLMLG